MGKTGSFGRPDGRRRNILVTVVVLCIEIELSLGDEGRRKREIEGVVNIASKLE